MISPPSSMKDCTHKDEFLVLSISELSITRTKYANFRFFHDFETIFMNRSVLSLKFPDISTFFLTMVTVYLHVSAKGLKG